MLFWKWSKIIHCGKAVAFLWVIMLMVAKLWVILCNRYNFCIMKNNISIIYT